VSELEYQGNELAIFASARNWKSYYAVLLKPYISGRVLEVGAGIGGTMPSLWNSSVESWLCLEPDPALARELVTRIEAFRHQEVTSRVGTLVDLPSDGRFDCILYIDVLEHIKDDRAELRNASRRLSPGGRLIVLSPAFQWLFSSFDDALGHERRYTAQSLADVFPPELIKERVFYADSVGALLSASNRILLRKSLPTLRQVLFWDRAVVPVSRIVDPLTRSWFGRSVIAVYSRPEKVSATDG
jgi:SAM-dependent methyltransferase